jgi:glutamine amidotransferase PdxT
LKDAFESSSGPQRDQLYAAIVGLPHSPEKAWTFQQIAERYLDEEHQDGFLNLIPENVRQSAFEIDSTLFESKLNIRVFETQDGVWISAPNSEIGRSVRVVQKTNRIVVDGMIKNQSVRSRHVK